MPRKKKSYRFLFFIMGLVAGLGFSTYFALHVAKKFDPHFTLRKERIQEAVQTMIHPNAVHVNHSLAFDHGNAFMRQSAAMSKHNGATKQISYRHTKVAHVAHRKHKLKHLRLVKRHKPINKVAVK